MGWLYEGREVEDADLETAYGFVYRIDNLATGRKYIGKKFLFRRKTTVRKGKKKRSLVDSGWRAYWGSNDALLADIAELGEDRFTRTILRFCQTKGECNYFEAKYQFEHDVLLKDEWYNSWIYLRVAKSHLGKVQLSPPIG